MPPRLRAIASAKFVAVVVAAAVLTALPVADAAAQGLFDFLFGGARRAPAPPPQYNSYAPSDYPDRYRDGGLRHDERAGDDRRVGPSRNSGAPRVAYCVRLCDGRYFPIRERGDASAANLCAAHCPASPTGLFYGREIDNARSRQGKNYADLENAFVYRKRIVSDCTCNGKSTFGTARMSVEQDPTLQKGDIVATGSGLTVYNGKRQDTSAAYTPIDDAKLGKSARKMLSGIEVRGGSGDDHKQVSAQAR